MTSDHPLVRKAFLVAIKAHEGQVRQSGLPYITHPMGVMGILEKHGFSADILAAAVMHDVCEDSDFTPMMLVDEFPEDVVFVVAKLSKNQKPTNNKKWLKEYQAAKARKKENTESFEAYIDYRMTMYLRQLYLGMLADPAVMAVKMADQIHNLSDMEALSSSKKLRKINEVRYNFIPLYENVLNTLEAPNRFHQLFDQLQETVRVASDLEGVRNTRLKPVSVFG